MSQVNFFMDDADEAAFVEMLRARGDTAIHPGLFSKTSRPRVLAKLPPFGPARTLVLSNREHHPTVTLRQRGEGRYRDHFMFDESTEMHFELTRSHRHDELLVAGRIYAKIGRLGSPAADRAFRGWYASIDRWVKKHYRRHRDIWWIGPSAERWSRAGGVLAFGDENALRESLRESRVH